MSGWFNKHFDPKQLKTQLLVLAIVSIAGALWTSLSKATSRWFWADADVSIGGIIILIVVGLGTIVVLTLALQRAQRRTLVVAQECAGTAAPSTKRLEDLRLRDTEVLAIIYLAKLDGGDAFASDIQKDLGIGNLQAKGVLNSLRSFGLVEIKSNFLAGPGYQLVPRYGLTNIGIQYAADHDMLP